MMPFTKTPSHPAIGLCDHLDHFASPFDYAAAFGGERSSSALLCPVCDTSAVYFDVAETISICRHKGGSITVPLNGSPLRKEDPNEESAIWVCIPMRCSEGHQWSLDFDQRNGAEVRFGTLLSTRDYAPYIPVTEELDDYDDENSVIPTKNSEVPA